MLSREALFAATLDSDAKWCRPFGLWTVSRRSWTRSSTLDSRATNEARRLGGAKVERLSPSLSLSLSLGRGHTHFVWPKKSLPKAHTGRRELEALFAFPLLAAFFACAPPLSEVVRIWDALFALGAHLSVPQNSFSKSN